MSAKPTESELAILSVLWRRGPSTVREVYDELAAQTGYTTVLKLMQIMADKGLVKRDERSRSHVYRAAVPQERTQSKLVGELLRRAFGGSIRKLMVAALSAERATPEELREIRKLIDDAEKSNASGGGKRSDPK